LDRHNNGSIKMGQSGKGNSDTQPFQLDDATRRQAYMQMMGNGNNGGNAPYGGVIPQQQNAPPPPPGTPPPATNTANTRYGSWDGTDYHPTLPWGLFAQSVGDSASTGFLDIGRSYGSGVPGEATTGLQWDLNTGQVVGGDQLLDQFRSTWQPGVRDFGIANSGGRDYGGQGSGTGFGGGWLKDARGGLGPLPPTWSLSTEWGIPTAPGSGITQYPDWWDEANDPNAIWGGTPSATPESWLGAPPSPYVKPPGPPIDFIINGTDAPIPQNAGATAMQQSWGSPYYTPSGGESLGSGGDLGSNPWGSMNDIGRRMTNASSYGRHR
jgi:hypothetical protein